MPHPFRNLFPLSLIVMATASLPARADVPAVAADIGPVHGLVAAVMDGVGEPEVVIPAGRSPHHASLRPSEARRLQEAEIVVWIGPDLTPQLDDAIGALSGAATILTLSEVDGIEVLPPRTGIRFAPADAHAAQHDAAAAAHGTHDDHAHAGQDDHADHGDHGDAGHADHADHAGDGHGHAHGDADPHLWLSPDNAVAWLGPIAEVLSAVDPDNAARYADNARRAEVAIAAARDRAAARLAPVRDVPFVVMHDAFQYFERAFGLAAVAAISLSDAVEPGPARVAALRQVVAETAAVCLFTEPELSTALADTVFAEAGLRRGVLDPLGAGIAPGPGMYPALIEALSASAADCLM